MGFGRRRRERELQELLERMERLDGRAVDLSDPASGTHVVARSRSALPSLLVLLVIVGLFGAWRFGLLAPLGDFGRPPTYVTVNGSRIAVPFPPKNSTRLLPPVQVSTQGAHAFLFALPGGKPTGYDPCRPVRYVIRPDGMPPLGERLITESIAEVSALTGLKFEYAGPTTEQPASSRAVIQPSRYGEDWAPVLIAWTSPAEVPDLAGSVAGIGGSAEVPGASGSGEWLAAGRLALDTQDITRILAGRDGYSQAKAVVLHELGHVVGLDHVQDRAELMFPETATLTDFGPGDREGLALVGQVSCERG
jgi:Matrixin